MYQFLVEQAEEPLFLTLEDVFFAHEQALKTGGLSGCLNRDYLEAAIQRPQNVHYYEGEGDLVCLASYLIHGIATAHAFMDGNKRTALLSGLMFLEANGIELGSWVASDEPGIFIDQSFKDKSFSTDALQHWLRQRCAWITAE